MNVEPWIGMRVRLLSKGAGKWATSGGEHAKFGLSTAEILEAIEILREAKMESAFKLLHFHIGSQIPDILTIKRAVREAAMYYAKLHKLGHPLEYLDVGGGLAIDYDGSRSTFHSSMNYTVEEYASDIVYNIMDVCDDEKVPHPNIVSESGRAIVAHHSVLVVQAFGAIEKTPLEPRTVQARDHKLTREILDIDQSLSDDNVNEAWHDLAADQGAGAEDVRARPARASTSRRASRRSSGRSPRSCRHHPAHGSRRSAGGSAHAQHRAGRPAHLQLLRLPVAARSLGPRPALSRSCRFTGSTKGRSSSRRSSTSPAIPTARSRSTSTSTTSARRCPSTSSATASPTTSASS